MKRIELRVTARGKIFGIAPDNLDLTALGKVRIDRLSHVEFSDWCQRWRIFSVIDKRWLPVRFRTRKEALQYEVSYMEKRMGKVRKLAGV